ncbi:MAG: autotransporter domain-containing protein [Planctomycetes bacterium]|nr:autotransporter domain-containing protein [Planctomycetota bacterium]
MFSGGSVGGNAIGGHSDTGNAIGNTVNISGGPVGVAQGGSSINGNATGNTVNIFSGGSVSGGVIGGGSTNGNATGNTVNIFGGSVGSSVRGGWVTLGAGNATGNTVNISGTGLVGTDVFGGQSASGNATGNTVNISGTGSVGGSVYGGSSTGGAATGNTVNISGSPTFGVATVLYGGDGGGGGDYFTGNTLNVWNYKGSGPVAGVRNFQFLNFAFPSTQSGPVLEVTGTARLGDGAAKGSTITAGTIGGKDSLKPGSSVTLIDAGTLDTTHFTQTKAKGMHGATLAYQWTLSTAGDMLVATLDKVQANPQAKALSEGFLIDLPLLNESADFLAGKGISWARTASGNGFGMFGGVSGGWSRYNTGSHVDMSSVSLIAGLAWGADLSPGRLTIGAFFEYGNGSYDTYNSFSNAASVNGDGDIYHLGGGVLGRMDFVNNVYAEASARAGGVSNEYKNGDLRDAMGRKASYDSDSAYYGLHAGLGYIWNITEQASLDLYGKYFWTRQEGDSVTLSTGDPVKFKGVDSHRLRLGGRLTYAVNEYVSPYVGAAYEHEFDGKARATTYGHDIDAPSLSGGTGIGELGVTLTPSIDLPLSFDLGVQGYVGTREGVTGSLQVKYEF